jgi:hypothetical protein
MPLQDIVDLRRKGWVGKSGGALQDGPKTILEIREAVSIHLAFLFMFIDSSSDTPLFL